VKHVDEGGVRYTIAFHRHDLTNSASFMNQTFFVSSVVHENLRPASKSGAKKRKKLLEGHSQHQSKMSFSTKMFCFCSLLIPTPFFMREVRSSEIFCANFQQRLTLPSVAHRFDKQYWLGQLRSSHRIRQTTIECNIMLLALAGV
jgi:hypothetical protein